MRKKISLQNTGNVETKTIDEASTKMNEFVNDYNTTRFHTAIRCTPIERFNSVDDDDTINLFKTSIYDQEGYVEFIKKIQCGS